MSELDKRIETVLDGLLMLADQHNIELTVENTFDKPETESLSCITHNPGNNQFGIISTNVEEYIDEPVCFFLFDSKLYTYCKMEGFDTANMLDGFKNILVVFESPLLRAVFLVEHAFFVLLVEIEIRLCFVLFGESGFVACAWKGEGKICLLNFPKL